MLVGDALEGIKYDSATLPGISLLALPALGLMGGTPHQVIVGTGTGDVQITLGVGLSPA